MFGVSCGEGMKVYYCKYVLYFFFFFRFPICSVLK